MVEDVCLLPGARRNRPLPLLLPHHVEIEDRKVVIALPVVRLATYKLLVSVDAIVGLEHLATTVADKQMDNGCQILCWLCVGNRDRQGLI